MPFNFIADVLLNFLSLSWWFWAFVILLPAGISTWLYWRQEIFKKKLNWVVLELKMPREIRKNPRAMEQVFTSFHALRNAPADIAEKWWDGEITRWYALEIASFGGETHFYVRGYNLQKGLLEAAFLSYYPEIEIVEIDDYIERLPANIKELHEQGYDLWGSEMKLDREEAYPIKVYSEFEAPEEEKQYDPMAAFLEFMATIKKEEIVCIQFLIAPKAREWRDKWDGLIEELRFKKAAAEAAKPKTATSFHGGPLPQFEVVKPEQNAGTQFFRSFMRTPGETDVLKAVENNLSKPAFDTLIRFIYLSPKSLYYDSFPRRAITACFNQFAALDLNSLSRNETMSTRVRFWKWPHLFPRRRNEYRKSRILYNYRRREIPPKTFMGRLLTSHLLNWNFTSRSFAMNTECLATIFHPPTYLVLTAPHIRRVESRKAGPPAGTAVFGGEEEIEKYK